MYLYLIYRAKKKRKPFIADTKRKDNFSRFMRCRCLYTYILKYVYTSENAFALFRFWEFSIGFFTSMFYVYNIYTPSTRISHREVHVVVLCCRSVYTCSRYIRILGKCFPCDVATQRHNTKTYFVSILSVYNAI